MTEPKTKRARTATMCEIMMPVADRDDLLAILAVEQAKITDRLSVESVKIERLIQTIRNGDLI